VHGRADEVVPFVDVAEQVAKHVGAAEPVRFKPLTGVGHSFAGALGIAWASQVAAAVISELERPTRSDMRLPAPVAVRVSS
jgi:hypothetical protein